MFVFIWKIENYSYSWHLVSECFKSPSFQMHPTDGISWHLKLYPRGILYENFTGLYLERELVYQGPVSISVDYDLSFLKSDGTPAITAAEKSCVFAKGQTYGFGKLVTREEVVQTKKSIFLSDDTLTVQCRICLANFSPQKQIKVITKSTIMIHRQRFLWDAGEFSFISPCKQGVFSSFSVQRGEVSLNLNEDSIYFHLKVKLDVNRMFRFRIGILDSNKSTSRFIIDKYILSWKTQSFQSLLIKRSQLLQRKDLYLPEDHLILHCEMNYSKGIHKGQLDCYIYDDIFALDEKKNSEENPPSTAVSRCCANNYNSMKNDFQDLYKEGTLCDFTIRVGSENLHVHKAVLCARSPIFKAFLTSNTMETEKNMVDFSCLEMDIVRRMLTFMYTDTVDDLNWVAAIKLYDLADKYDLKMLKCICTEFLKINLMFANVEDVLILANIHDDEDLKEVALKFLHRIGKM